MAGHPPPSFLRPRAHELPRGRSPRRWVSLTIRIIDGSAAEVAGAIEQQRSAIGDISRNTQSASASAAQVSSNLQELHATFAEVGNASGDIRGKIGSLGESVQALRAETETFLRDVLAA
jgi:methyl-accepting chemotaxis protein